MSERYISPLVIRRLPKYHRCLKELERSGVERVSSNVLAETLGFTASQVRQDFSCFGGFGQQGYGYNVASLRQKIAEIIGVDKCRNAVLIGVGNLGHALLHNFDFNKCGFELCAAFDVSKDLIGTSINNVEVLDMKKIEEYSKQTPFEVAVLTVPRQFAKETAQRLVELGVRGIWNFTNVDMNFEENGVKVENVHFADSLKILCYEISREN